MQQSQKASGDEGTSRYLRRHFSCDDLARELDFLDLILAYLLDRRDETIALAVYVLDLQ